LIAKASSATVTNPGECPENKMLANENGNPASFEVNMPVVNPSTYQNTKE
jgi:hypothetical protein